MTDEIDLDAYFRRIGYSGSREATLETLRALHLRHPQAIPFENIDPLLRRPVGVDLAGLQHKLVGERRGGWCFEQNLLFRAALTALGFRATGLAARVLWNQPENAITTRNHMLLRVDLDGIPYIADVGFGRLTLTSPLRLEPDIEQETPHEPFRLLRKNGDYRVQARIGTGWKTLYRFDLQEQFLPDYAVSSHYLATHPDSHFLAALIAARPDGEQRYALRNNQLAIHHLDGRTKRRTLAGAEEIRTVLERDFRLPLPDAPELDATLDKLAASGS